MLDIKCMLHSTPQLLCTAISCPNSAARCALRNSYMSSVMCQLLFHFNKNWNINKLPNKKNSMKICTGAWVLICRHIQTNKHSEANRHTVTTFHDKYATKIIGCFLEMLLGITFSGGTTEVCAKPLWRM